MTVVATPPPRIPSDPRQPAPPSPPSPVGGGNKVLDADLESSVSFICQHVKYLSLIQKDRLKKSMGFDKLIDPQAPEESMATVATNYGAEFDLAEEVEAQIRAVRSIRANVFDVNGNLKSSVTSREAKEIISTGSTMLGTLMKYHEKVMNMERLRKLEQSVVEALLEVDEDFKAKVMESLEKKLEAAEL